MGSLFYIYNSLLVSCSWYSESYILTGYNHLWNLMSVRWKTNLCVLLITWRLIVIDQNMVKIYQYYYTLHLINVILQYFNNTCNSINKNNVYKQVSICKSITNKLYLRNYHKFPVNSSLPYVSALVATSSKYQVTWRMKPDGIHRTSVS